MLGSRKSLRGAFKIQREYKVDGKVSVYSAETEISLPVFHLFVSSVFLRHSWH